MSELTHKKYAMRMHIHAVGSNKKVGKIFFTEDFDKNSGNITYNVVDVELPKEYDVIKQKIRALSNKKYKHLSMKLDSILLPYNLFSGKEE